MKRDFIRNVLRSVQGLKEAFTLFNLEGTARQGLEGMYLGKRMKWKIDGGLAQLGERLPCKQEVSGSIPLISTSSNKK